MVPICAEVTVFRYPLTDEHLNTQEGIPVLKHLPPKEFQGRGTVPEISKEPLNALKFHTLVAQFMMLSFIKNLNSREAGTLISHCPTGTHTVAVPELPKASPQQSFPLGQYYLV